MDSLNTAIENLITQLKALPSMISEAAEIRARELLTGAAGGSTKKRGAKTKKLGAIRKGAPKLCRVPGCGNSASPRDNLFCKEKHRDWPVTKKKKYLKK